MLSVLETIGRFLWIPLFFFLVVKTNIMDTFVYRQNRDSLMGSKQETAEPKGTWKTAAALPSTRYEFSAATIGNDIYVVGGVYLPSVYTGTGQVEIYHGKTNTWSDAPPVPIPMNHVGVVSDGK
jgi:hypothetical protein